MKTAEIPAGPRQHRLVPESAHPERKAHEGDRRPRSKRSPTTSSTAEEKKLRDLYDAFEDQAQIDAAGSTPARRISIIIARLKTKADVARAMADPCA